MLLEAGEWQTQRRTSECSSAPPVGQAKRQPPKMQGGGPSHRCATTILPAHQSSSCCRAAAHNTTRLQGGGGGGGAGGYLLVGGAANTQLGREQSSRPGTHGAVMPGRGYSMQRTRADVPADGAVVLAGGEEEGGVLRAPRHAQHALGVPVELPDGRHAVAQVPQLQGGWKGGCRRVGGHSCATTTSQLCGRE